MATTPEPSRTTSDIAPSNTRFVIRSCRQSRLSGFGQTEQRNVGPSTRFLGRAWGRASADLAGERGRTSQGTRQGLFAKIDLRAVPEQAEVFSSVFWLTWRHHGWACTVVHARTVPLHRRPRKGIPVSPLAASRWGSAYPPVRLIADRSVRSGSARGWQRGLPRAPSLRDPK